MLEPKMFRICFIRSCLQAEFSEFLLPYIIHDLLTSSGGAIFSKILSDQFNQFFSRHVELTEQDRSPINKPESNYNLIYSNQIKSNQKYFIVADNMTILT